ncbi:hypothetical protein FPZ12_009105 [Amycolatopsis acidicola]|uniref:Uncharacterized protein n=1 Tax=Amycolatopsis acidicola TaxID=2596893 RepID=A0A5N0VDH6_9PSEU|nr:DUF6498-containing protein [Amycolatopsis acidicola]KAA9163648.1 hypothetical protein FPZ12_009105 [Amycolatopsis acidicola]
MERDAWRGAVSGLVSTLLRKFARSDSRAVSVAALVLVNLLPVAAVAWRGWRWQDVLIVYWLENLALSIWGVLKIRTARGPRRVTRYTQGDASRTVSTGPTTPFGPGFPSSFRIRTPGGSNPRQQVASAGSFFFQQAFTTVFTGFFLWMTGGFFAGTPKLTILTGAGVLAGLLLGQGVAYVFDWFWREERYLLGPADVYEYGMARTGVLLGGVALGLILTFAPLSVGLRPVMDQRWSVVVLVVAKTALEIRSLFTLRARRRNWAEEEQRRVRAAESGTAPVRVFKHSFVLGDARFPGSFENLDHSTGLGGLGESFLLVRTGIERGTITVSAAAFVSRPGLDTPEERERLQEWEDVAEFSLAVPDGELRVRAHGGGVDLPRLSASGPGCYRVRVHARGRDVRHRDLPESEETYSVITWPEEPSPPLVIKATSRCGMDEVLRRRPAG